MFTLDVVDLPYVQRLELEYHFPAYTGLEPRNVEDGGDIAVLTGTEVRVTVTPTMTTPAGRIVLHENGAGAAHRRRPTARWPAASRPTRTASTASSWRGPTAT